MTQMVQLPELRAFMLKTGLTISGISETTKVSRNTLAAIRDGKEISFNSVTKMLSSLERAQYDVAELTSDVQRRIDVLNEKRVGHNSGLSIVIDNTILRNTARISSDLRAIMKKCESLAAELLRSVESRDYDINLDDPRNIQRLEQKIRADLDEIFTLLRAKNQTPPS